MVSSNKIRLGVIGMSEGNGHPYSWSAIFNGYDAAVMKTCPFSAIPAYLDKQRFPDDQIQEARVTHIWTQDTALSEHIAHSTHISNVVAEFADMIGEVDAVLLARDDADNHLHFSEPFLKAGLPIYIDKPLATSVDNAEKLLTLQKYDWQIFSCSALKYAHEFQLNETELDQLGELRSVEAVVPKSWEKYAVHAIDPLVSLIGLNTNDVNSYSVSRNADQIMLILHLKNQVSITIKNTGLNPSEIYLHLHGNRGEKKLIFGDSFFAFRTALNAFIVGIQQQELQIPRSETLNIIRIIEMGLRGK